MKLVNSAVYGKNTKPTIYYIVGFTGRLKQYRLHIWALKILGFRVYAFEYSNDVLNAGNAQIIIDVINNVTAQIEADKKGRVVAGVYGVSLGVFIGLNAMIITGVDVGVLNSGAAKLAETIWHNPRLAYQKRKFKGQGYNLERLQQIWGKYEITPDPTRFQNMHLLFMNSKADKTISYSDVKSDLSSWMKSGVDVKLITNYFLDHVQAIVRNMLRLIKTVNFYRNH